MKILLISTLLFVTSSIYAQHIFDEKQNNCDYKGMSLENSKIKIDYESKQSLYSDLIRDVDPKTLSKVRGEIMIQVLVDGEGMPCCISVSNKTNVPSNKLRLVKNVNAMPGWQKLGTPTKKVSVIVKLIYEADQVLVKRLGVNESRTFVELESFEVPR
jgi:hypothetical protein